MPLDHSYQYHDGRAAFDCYEQYPDRKWEIWDGTSSEMAMAELLYSLVRMLKPKLVVETGCYTGHSTYYLAMAVKKNDYGRVISIDIELDCINKARERCAGFEDVCEIRHGNVCGGLPELEAADFIFSDSGYEMRFKEMERAKAGAVVVVHDTDMSYDGRYKPGALGDKVNELGGLCFHAGRGFGVIVKP